MVKNYFPISKVLNIVMQMEKNLLQTDKSLNLEGLFAILKYIAMINGIVCLPTIE